MPRAINTYDVFDTLIARRSGEPHAVLHQLEARAPLPGLAAARIVADQRLGSQGKPYLLRDIWREVGRALRLDQAAIEHLHEMEVKIEYEQVIPIVENMGLVRDGDLLVSDTYLPADIVLSLLRRAGLQRTVALVVSNDGKHRSWVWPQLLRQVAIREHLGDNPHSDGKTASAAGIRAIIYTGSRRTAVKQLLCERGWGPLAALAREVRLINPLPPARAQERHLWLLTCQLNFPLLFFTSLFLEHYVREAGLREVFFISRDCQLWHQLYRQLFPQRHATYLYTSRQCLFKPTPSYLDYFRSTWHPEGILVDLLSTGLSWSRFFRQLQSRGRCFFLGRIDDYAYLSDTIRPEDWLDMKVVFRTSQLGKPVNKAVEMLNYAPHPVVEDVLCLPGQAALPILADTLEYDVALPTAAHQSFQSCVQRLASYPALLRSRGEALEDFIGTFVGLICSDPHLDTIYASHQAWDAAYVQRILG